MRDGGSSEADVALLQLVLRLGHEARPEQVAQGFVELLERTAPDRWSQVAGLAAGWLQQGSTPALTTSLLGLRTGRRAEPASEPATGATAAGATTTGATATGATAAGAGASERSAWQRRLLAWKTGGSGASLTRLVEQLVAGDDEAVRAQVADSPAQPPAGSTPVPLRWRLASPGGEVTLATEAVVAVRWGAEVIAGPWGGVMLQDGRALPVVAGTAGPVAVLGGEGSERRAWLTGWVEVEPARAGEP